MSRAWGNAGMALAAAWVVLGLAGCGTPGVPQPPSLNLPDRVENLSATRSGNEVKLTWTMPKRNTDKIVLKADVAVHVCRREGESACAPVADLSLAPAVDATVTDTLPEALTAGTPRRLSYFVELRNRRGRSAGLSNAAVVLAGQAPAPVIGLAAEVRKNGVVLGWNAEDAHEAIRLRRTLLNPPPKKAQEESLSAPAEPLKMNLLVENDTGRALDKEIVFGRTYEYRAQRIARVDADGASVELDGAWSAPVRIEAADVFPPPVPVGLAAVATGATTDTGASIDLNWQPVTDPGLAGYFVYRREADTPWRRISGEQPVAAPAFHDAQVVPGHAYLYGVSAVDRNGRESTRSADAEETVPPS